MSDSIVKACTFLETELRGSWVAGQSVSKLQFWEELLGWKRDNKGNAC